MALGRKRRKRRDARPPPGASPGTLAISPDAKKPVLRVLAYSAKEFVEKDVTDLAELVALRAAWPVLWLNVDGTGDEALMMRIGEIFQIHKLALADAVSSHQRAKVEEYEDQLFIVMRMVLYGERLDSEQVSLVLGRGFVVTFQEGIPGDCFEPVRARIRELRGKIRAEGADYLCYALVDAILDNYFPVLEAYGEALESLEDVILEDPTPEVVGKIHATKRDLIALRRAIWPAREALGNLSREPYALIRDTTRLYLRDCYDHAIQVIDLVEGDREIASDLIDMYLSSVSHRMNEVMKWLTIMASIFIPLTFIAGIYGMNFDTTASRFNMPELRHPYGYPLTLLAMFTIACGMIVLFARKGWLKRSRIAPGAKADIRRA